LPIQELELPAAEKLGEAVSMAVGAHSLSALRKVSASQVLSASVQLPGSPRFGPIRDGQLVRIDLGSASGSAPISDVPILTGMNANEAGPASPLGNFWEPPVELTTVNYAAWVHRQYGADAAQVLREYPASEDSQVLTVARQLARDRGLAAIMQWKG
jgi:para-nitrobenzyl esterase